GQRLASAAGVPVPQPFRGPGGAMQVGVKRGHRKPPRRPPPEGGEDFNGWSSLRVPRGLLARAGLVAAAAGAALVDLPPLGWCGAAPESVPLPGGPCPLAPHGVLTALDPHGAAPAVSNGDINA